MIQAIETGCCNRALAQELINAGLLSEDYLHARLIVNETDETRILSGGVLHADSINTCKLQTARELLSEEGYEVLPTYDPKAKKFGYTVYKASMEYPLITVDTRYKSYNEAMTAGLHDAVVRYSHSKH